MLQRSGGSIALVRAFVRLGLSLLRLRQRLQCVHNTSASAALTASIGNALRHRRHARGSVSFACRVSSYNISYNFTGQIDTQTERFWDTTRGVQGKRRGRNKLGGKSRQVIHTARNPDRYTTDFRRLCGGDKLPGLYSIQNMSIPS